MQDEAPGPSIATDIPKPAQTAKKPPAKTIKEWVKTVGKKSIPEHSDNVASSSSSHVPKDTPKAKSKQPETASKQKAAPATTKSDEKAKEILAKAKVPKADEATRKKLGDQQPKMYASVMKEPAVVSNSKGPEPEVSKESATTTMTTSATPSAKRKVEVEISSLSSTERRDLL